MLDPTLEMPERSAPVWGRGGGGVLARFVRASHYGVIKPILQWLAHHLVRRRDVK